MMIDDSIVKSYLSGISSETYKDCWIYSAFGSDNLLEDQDPANYEYLLALN